MTNRRFTLLTFAAIALATFLLPAAANAQGTIWDRIRDRAEQERERDRNNTDPDYRRDRRDDDRYGRRNGRISDYERRQLRDVANRVNSRSHDLQRDIDRLLDNSRYDGSRREDNVNQEARELRDAAQRFKDVAGDSNDLYRSTDEARTLLDRASRINRVLGRVRVDSRTSNDWNQLRNDLRTVADIYGLRFNDNGGSYGNDDDWRRNRRNVHPY
jgi:hypothetical protein